tara:strand:- start:81 stop:251 length:171 start_codon:yes stop_codon:yes gene_type:complete
VVSDLSKQAVNKHSGRFPVHSGSKSTDRGVSQVGITRHPLVTLNRNRATYCTLDFL